MASLGGSAPGVVDGILSHGPDHDGGSDGSGDDDDDLNHNNDADDAPNANMDYGKVAQCEEETVPAGKVQVPTTIMTMMSQLMQT